MGEYYQPTYIKGLGHAVRNGWWSDTGRRTRREKKGRPGLRRMAGVELDLRNVGLNLWRTRTLGGKKQNGQLS